jgi:hypothetical protein
MFSIDTASISQQCLGSLGYASSLFKSAHHPMAQPQADADQIDGLHHSATPEAQHDDAKYDPFSASFAPFESPVASADLQFPYSNPSLNTSAPTLSLVSSGKLHVAGSLLRS